MSEALRNDELARVSRRFIEYVNYHTQPSISSLIGALRDGESFTDQTQLIPSDSVKFGVFDTNPESSESEGESSGYFISVQDGDIQRYAINLVSGQFYENDTYSGFSEQPVDPKVVDGFLDRLMRIKIVLNFIER